MGLKTWGHRIDLLGPTGRAWLNCSARCRYLYRYVETKGDRNTITRTVCRPLTKPAAAKLAKRLGLNLPDQMAPDPFTSPQTAGTAASA
jgi:hypothetical protein